MSKLLISFESPESIYEPQPWPIGIDENNRVTSGLGPDDGAILMGFGPLGEQHITVFAEDVRKDPSAVIGLAPSFSKDGGFFEWALRTRRERGLPEFECFAHADHPTRWEAQQKRKAA